MKLKMSLWSMRIGNKMIDGWLSIDRELQERKKLVSGTNYRIIHTFSISKVFYRSTANSNWRTAHAQNSLALKIC